MLTDGIKKSAGTSWSGTKARPRTGKGGQKVKCRLCLGEPIRLDCLVRHVREVHPDHFFESLKRKECIADETQTIPQDLNFRIEVRSSESDYEETKDPTPRKRQKFSDSSTTPATKVEQMVADLTEEQNFSSQDTSYHWGYLCRVLKVCQETTELLYFKSS